MSACTPMKSLVVCPVGKAGKEFVRRIVERFGHDSFDFLLLVYDDCLFDEDCFNDCTVVHDGLPLFWRLKKYVTPELCRPYEYVFIWMDDLDVMDFDPQSFLRVLRTHRIDVGHPSLSLDSVISHSVMAHQDTAIGRYTDFAEILAFTFQADAWERFWRLIEPDRNPWGWGYDEVAYSVCRFCKIAVIDREVVKHTRKGVYHASVQADHAETHRRYSRHYLSRKKTLCEISDDPLRKYLMAPLRLSLHVAFARCHILPGAGGLRWLIRTYLRPLWTREPGMAAGSSQPSLDTSHESRAPIQARENVVPSGLLPDSTPAPTQDEPTEKPKRGRQMSTTKRVKAKVGK